MSEVWAGVGSQYGEVSPVLPRGGTRRDGCEVRRVRGAEVRAATNVDRVRPSPVGVRGDRSRHVKRGCTENCGRGALRTEVRMCLSSATADRTCHDRRAPDEVGCVAPSTRCSRRYTTGADMTKIVGLRLRGKVIGIEP